jgi:hypothetical protein
MHACFSASHIISKALCKIGVSEENVRIADLDLNRKRIADTIAITLQEMPGYPS